MELTIFILTHVAMIIAAITVITSGRSVEQKKLSQRTAKAESSNAEVINRKGMVVVHKSLPLQTVTDKLVLGQ